MNKRILGGLAAAAMLAGGLAISSAGTVAAVDVEPGQEVCGPLDSGKFDTSGVVMTVTITAPAGNLITGYCVKAGSDQSVPDGAVVYVTVDPAVASVTFPHPSGKSISHYSYSYAPIPPVEVMPAFNYTPPTCDAAGTAVPVQAEGVSWSQDGDTWNASATEGYVLTGKTVFGPYVLTQLTGPACKPATPVVPPPTPETPAVPSAAVAALPPLAVLAALPPTQAPTAVVAAAGLPATGSDETGVIALIALLITSLGGGALLVARRYKVTI